MKKTKKRGVNKAALALQIGRALEAIDIARVSLSSARQYLLTDATDPKLSKAFDFVCSALSYTTAASQKAWEWK